MSHAPLWLAWPIAERVDGHVGKTKPMEGILYVRGLQLVDELWDFVGADLDAGEVAVCADTRRGKVEPMKKLLGLTDSLERLHSDALTEGDARGKARGGGAIPHPKPQLMRQLAYLSFCESDIRERAHDAQLLNSSHAWAPCKTIVSV